MEAMGSFDIVDGHEHLPPEKTRTDQPQDVFTLFSHYIRHDLFSAGMDREVFALSGMDIWGAKKPEYERLLSHDIPLEERWRMFQPYWRAVRHGSYARAARLTAKLVYGVDDINDNTYKLLSGRAAAENTPGIYQRIFDRCRIKAVLTQCGRTDVEPPLIPVPRAFELAPENRESLERIAAAAGESVPSSLDAYLDFARRRVDAWVKAGAAGVKIFSRHYPKQDYSAAETVYRRILNSENLSGEEFNTLSSLIIHTVIDLAAERGLTVAAHAGIWGDFRDIDSKHMLALAPAHPSATFDLYHLGMPSVRDTIVIAKNLPNVNLNLCWTHILSQAQTCSGIDELLDQVPVTKVIAFGGDYSRPVEKIAGHLHMAKEDFAKVFGARIDRGLMDFDDAIEILKMWFWENPLKIYPRLAERIK